MNHIIKFALILGAFQVIAQDLKQMNYFVEREMFAKAKLEVQVLLKKEPSNADYHFYMGDIYFKNDQPDSARYWFMEGLKKSEKCALCYVGMGKVSMENNPTEGKANFDKALSTAPKDHRVYAAIGDYWLNLEKPEGKKAVEVLSKASEMDTKNLTYKMLLGDAHRFAADGSKGMALYKEVLAKDSMNPAVYWRIGKLYLGAKNYELGKENFSKGIEKDATFSPIYREFGELYYKWRKYDKAIEQYKKYLSLRDKSDDTDFRFASFLFLSKNYKESLTLLNSLNQKGYPNPVIHRLMAYSYYETKEYNNAASSMNAFWGKIKGDKINATDYEYQGKIHLKTGKDSLGILSLEKAIELDSNKKEAYKEFAEFYNEKGQTDKSLSCYRKYLASGKGNYNDYYSFGKICMASNKFGTADSAFAKVIDSRPELPQGYLWRARANGNLDPDSKNGLAKPYYEKYIEIGSKDAAKNKDGLVEAYSYLGSYYIDTKDKAKASEYWNLVKTTDPGNKAALEADKFLKTMK
ncbi:MAG: hypothetical protein MUF42_00020 [Cytophagaceae bacterium]|jgi:Tfp pilus assembly protein PilF|nr:hypothetical protein [Cytophagaceae bacterium]